jgi:2-succinyl-5-enolpyruvyl-6-hydroxy-3-cyclohexene-1-carboxylate synthase
MTYSAIPLAHTLVTLCKTHGLKQVVISPGSRNAPLTLAFASDPFFECFSIVDERSAAFFALGLSQQGREPVVLVCTSGSALLNYYPAIAEGYYSRIPLVVLSADRPTYKIDIGDGQTIRQDGVFEKHIGFQASLSQDLTHARESIRWPGDEKPGTPEQLEALQEQRQARNEQAICEAIRTARQQRLPVHLNAPFEEPLYGMQEMPPVHPGAPGDVLVKAVDMDWEPLREQWAAASRKMILIGAMPPGRIPGHVLEDLGGDPSVLVFTETTSNSHHPGFISSIDSLLAPIEKSGKAGEFFEALRPEVLLTLGGMVVSKKVKQFLRRYPPQAHWHIDPYDAPDTYYCLTRHVKLPAADFLAGFTGYSALGASHYKAPWLKVLDSFRNRRGEYLKRIPFSDFMAFSQVLEKIPGGMQVQLGNSSTVRYTQLFEMSAENPVFCNRGTSGIEGSTSTAVGASVNYKAPTVLITGDLSFFYDINGLWNNYLRADFRIIVINNGGGGIFRILPGKEDSRVFETYFETVQHRSVEALCRAYNLEYRSADTPEALGHALETFFEPSRSPALLEVKTPRERNDTVLLDYFDFLSSALPKDL